MLAIAVAAAEQKPTQQSAELTERDQMEQMWLAGGGGEHAYNKTIDRDDYVHIILFCLFVFSNSICNTLN